MNDKLFTKYGSVPRYTDGRTQVSERTVGAVMRMLKRQAKPMSITQLSNAIGKSYNTVKRALELGGAVKVDGSYPMLFTVSELYTPERVIGSSADTVQVPFVDHSPVVSRWNDSRKKFASALGQLEIKPDSDPDKLASDFTTAATTLASIAHAIAEAKRGPDWYAVLGGLTDESQ